ncbi:hypothetical protein [Tepidibacter formicigenes]|jgi:hypothetical protein|uniref:Uncharacterized protein n=1 Tax=Tepidibacter formicigenes DSM 15518 TaxID=1123349 RepID=A0A1M6LJG3_9FIRM|nr:hypothetical protein [Tepidibacter formicigenes]SHJ71325.1 hypothetical protein SAMN02744037_00656 [Tepidibacter formicigenes DSM 15518]
MKNFIKITIVLLVVVALIGGFFATSYNGLVNANGLLLKVNYKEDMI